MPPVDAAARLDLPVPANPHPYLAQMARFCDGELHRTRRAELLAVLPAPDGLETAARSATAALLADRLDVMPILTSVPVAVLGQRLGCADLSVEISALCEHGVVSAALPDIARTSLLFQCRDATAALAVIALSSPVLLADAVAVLRTRREGVGLVDLAAAPYGAGRHACPGREHALALAAGMISALAGHEVAEIGPDLGRPNLRLPSYLVMGRRPG